ncbi:MTP-1 family protein [Pseudogracilibacillus auburnensis]|uniref:MTP-1 family protein n=1 Tax=Pseudogracilibacillus auburnensis TaxID=1494959 RepID=UPI001A96B204|nr:DUF1861 family protein [Pseudogracilibacillus auburnensis]MBO1005147.1 DUF1861 family protein [Pseudogracilibacillus auburnensis]
MNTCEVLLEDFLNKEQPHSAQELHFTGVPGKDVYNITAPFEDEGELVIAGRVESRDSEQSEVYFFVNRDGKWQPRENASVFQLQDPFYTRIKDELVLGGVEIYPHPTIKDALAWRTIFYKGKNLSNLEMFFKGPDGMKDLRLIELADGSIGVLTRPQGDKGGRGKIGFTTISSLKELTVSVVDDAPLLEGQFIDEEWGGANEAHLLSNGLIGVLGHIASFDDEGNRHYYPMVFSLDPVSGEHSAIEIIGQRSDFLPGPAKRPDLVDVVFSGGLIRNEEGTAELYAGLSDASAQKIKMKDPFIKYEQQGEK